MSDEIAKEINDAIANITYEQDKFKQQQQELADARNNELENNQNNQNIDENIDENDLVDPELQQHQREASNLDDQHDSLRDEIDELFDQTIKEADEEQKALETNKRPFDEEDEEQGEKRQKIDETVSSEQEQGQTSEPQEEIENVTELIEEQESKKNDAEPPTEESNDKQTESSDNQQEQQEVEQPDQQESQPEQEPQSEQQEPQPEQQPEQTEQQNADPVVNEKEDLELIANQLEEATESNKEKRATENEQQDDEIIGTGIPSNSELLNTNTAYAAYTTLSSQLESHSQTAAMLSSATLSALPLAIIAPVYLPPRIQLLINTLPTIDNLATQLLRTVASSPYQKIIDLASNPDTPAGATYRDLTSLFEFTKRLYSEEDPFLTVEHLAPGMWKEGDETPNIFKPKQQSIESTLRKVNLATFLAATLGTMEIGFFYLNESFLDVFCPSNNLDPINSLSNLGSYQNGFQSTDNPIGAKIGKLLKTQATLYLDLKTQAYISAIDAGERSKEEILEDILPDNIDDYLKSRRDVGLLSPVESDFVLRCGQRKDLLLNYSSETHLSEEYEWFTFLKDLFDYVSKNMGYLIWGKMGRSVRDRKENTPHTQELIDNATAAAAASAAAATAAATSGSTTSGNGRLRGRPSSNGPSGPVDPEKMLVSELRESVLPVGSRPSSRRPWSREEEKALRHALELKGPHWATILELFGQGGKISEALKNRTQVQLKDKARNWKKFFLRSGLEVPSYLQGVTGGVDDSKRRKKQSQKTAAAPVPRAKKQASTTATATTETTTEAETAGTAGPTPTPNDQSAQETPIPTDPQLENTPSAPEPNIPTDPELNNTPSAPESTIPTDPQLESTVPSTEEKDIPTDPQLEGTPSAAQPTSGVQEVEEDKKVD